MKNRVIKGLLIGVCVLSIFLIYTWLTTYNLEDHKNELTHFSNKYANDTVLNASEITASVYKDRFDSGKESFSLYENKGKYFIVWSMKSIWSLGRYKVDGGTSFDSTANDSWFSEFQEMDSNGLVYIFYGKYKQSQIQLNITKFDDSSYIKQYKIDGDHTFVVYTSNQDCGIEPILS